MGNSQPIHSNDFVKVFDKNFSHIRDVNDERWGFANVFKDKHGPLLAMITNNNLDNDVDYLTVIKRLQSHNPQDHELICDYLGWSCLKSDDLCGDHRKIDIYTEYFDENLRKEIYRRQSGRLNFFQEEELWYLIESGVSLGAYWQQQSKYHGDYRPNQILFTNDGFYKMCDNSLVGLYRNNYFLTLNSTSKGYLSPELINYYRRRDVNPKYDVYRADVYSLGMTLLQAATLREPEVNFYDWPNEKILHKQIQQALLDLESHYSRELVDTIRTMLEEDEYSRPDFLGLAGGRVPKRNAVPILPSVGLSASVISPAPVAPVYNLPVHAPAPVPAPAPAPVNLYQSVAAPPMNFYQPAPVPAPAPVYQAPAPVYQAPAPVYQAPAPVYQEPAPVYQAPAPVYQAPAPVYQEPAPVYQAPAPVYQAPAPVYQAPAPVYQPSAPVYQTSLPQAPAPYQAPATQFAPQVSSYQPSAPQFSSTTFQVSQASFAPRNLELPQSPQAFRQQPQFSSPVQPQFSSPVYRAAPQQYQPLPQGGLPKPQAQPQAQEQPKDVKDEINDLDKRVRDAIKNSEEAIKRNAGLPVKNA